MKRPTILLTDDQVGCSEIIWHVLRELGCEMIYVEDKAEALARLPEIRPDLVITDLTPRGLNGLDLIRKVKAYDTNIRAIVVSGTLDENTVTQAMQLGACHCLDKPFDVEELRGAVRRALNLENS